MYTKIFHFGTEITEHTLFPKRPATVLLIRKAFLERQNLNSQYIQVAGIYAKIILKTGKLLFIPVKMA